MFLSNMSIVIMAIGSVLSAAFVIILLISNKYLEYITPLDEKEFPLHEVYGFGFMIIDLLHYNFD